MALDVTMMAVMGVLALVLLVLGVPLWLNFFLTSTTALIFFTRVPLQIIPSELFGSINNFVLIAVPGFLFIGEIMTRSRMGDDLIRWIRALIGPVPGGIPITTAISGALFGAISGSSAAAAAAIGKVLYPGLREEGYPEEFSLGLLTSTGAIAIVIPPSITLILYAAVAEVSLGRLFIAGTVPGLLLGGGAAVYSVGMSFRHNAGRGDFWNLAEILSTTKGSVFALGVPVVIFGGIYGGYATATEVAMLGSVYVVTVALLLIQDIDVDEVWEAAYETALLTSKIFLITACAGLFSWVLTTGGLPQAISDVVNQLDLSIVAVLLLINVILIISGMFIDPVSNVLVLTPIFLPTVVAVGVDPIHFGVVMAMNMAIGMFTPPFGLNIFVISSILEAPTTTITRGIIPFFVIYVIGLLTVTYNPELALWLPNALGI